VVPVTHNANDGVLVIGVNAIDKCMNDARGFLSFGDFVFLFGF